MLSELHKLLKLIWQKKKMLWLITNQDFFYSVYFHKKYAALIGEHIRHFFQKHSKTAKRM